MGVTLIASSIIPVERAYSDDGDDLQQNIENYTYDVARWDKNRIGISGPPELQEELSKAIKAIEDVAEIDFVEGGDDIRVEFSNEAPHSMYYTNHELYAKREDLTTTWFSRIKVYGDNFTLSLKRSRMHLSSTS